MSFDFRSVEVFLSLSHLIVKCNRGTKLLAVEDSHVAAFAPRPRLFPNVIPKCQDFYGIDWCTSRAFY